MRVKTGSRLHLGLIDLNGDIGRKDGGAGLSINNPGVTIDIDEAEKLQVKGPESSIVKDYAKTVLDYFDIDPVALKIESTIPRHTGLGSGTQLALATAKAITEYNGIELSTRKLSNIVGRGGTSGIGTYAFDRGGFIVDGGHSSDDKEQFLPASASDAPPPPLTSRMEFPEWNIKLFLPEGSDIYGTNEESLFVKETPIPIDEVRKVSHIILMKLMPAVRDANFREFKEAIDSLQSIGWKAMEVQKQPKSKDIINNLSSQGVAAGLSSWGPTVFAVSPNRIHTPEIDCEVISVSKDNSGAKILKNE